MSKKYPVPYYAELKTSNIPKAGLGIFAKEFIAKGTRLDFYKGVRLTPKKYERKRSHKNHIWAISNKKGKVVEYIDGGNKAKSNWLRYVNCPRNKEEENVVATQEDDNIIYWATKDVEKGEELMVWYGEDYGLLLIGKKSL